MSASSPSTWLEHAAAQHPERLAIVAGDTALNYAELLASTRRRAAFLADLKIGPGSRVALIADNSLSWLLAAHAILMSGATLLPLHHRANAEDLQTQLGIVPADLIICDDVFAQALHADTPTTSLREFDNTYEFNDLHDALEALRTTAEPPTKADEYPLVILFTSGTTGTPRAVPLSADNIYASAMASAERLGVEHYDRWLCCLPLCHMGGLATMLRSLIYATTLELAAESDAASIIGLLTSRPITLLSLVPTQVHRLLRVLPEPFATSLRAVLVGGGPIDVRDLQEARALGLPVLPTYGMSEAASQITTLPLDAPLDALASAGAPLPGTELRITLEDGSLAATDQPGAIEVRGPTLSRGYLNPDAPPLQDAEGWMRTGDVGHLDERGFLYVHHRASQRIVSGGENIDPVEIERTLRELGVVRDVAAFALDHPEWGQQLCCALVWSDDTPDSTETSAKIEASLVELQEGPILQHLLDHCRQTLSDFKIPRRWFLTDAIPRTASEKVRRHRLVELAGQASRQTH